MATLEGLPDPSQVSSADAAARLAAAEAANLAWRTNTAPVLPVMGAGSASGITQAEQADAAREAAKHAAAFHPAEYYGVDPASLGNVPLSMIAARYGTGFADIVQGYYTQNPTAEARAITAQYEANRSAGSALIAGGASGSYRQDSFTPTVLAGEGGFTGRAAEYAKDWKPLSDTLSKEARASQQGQKGSDYASIGNMPNPFGENTAAGITWDIARSGGTVGASVAAKALPEFQKRGVSAMPTSWITKGEERSVVPVSALDTSEWWGSPTPKAVVNPNMIISPEWKPMDTSTPGLSGYFRIGNQGDSQYKTEFKFIGAESGAFTLLSTPKSTMPGSDFKRIYPMITGGASDYGMQGNTLTGSPYVRDSGKPSMAGVKDEYGLNKLWEFGSRDDWLYQSIKRNPSAYTKSGGELGGGFVEPIAGRTIQSEFAKGNLIFPGEYSPQMKSYAQFTNVAAENAPKGTISSEANLPSWGDIGASQFAQMPAIQMVDLGGNLTARYSKTLEVNAPTQETTPPWAAWATAPSGEYNPIHRSKPTSGLSLSQPIAPSEDVYEKQEPTIDWYKSIKASVPVNPIFDALAEGDIWVGGTIGAANKYGGFVSPLGFAAGTKYLAENIALEQNKGTYSGAITHAQAHETGFFSPEQSIIGNVKTDQLYSIQRGRYGSTDVDLAGIPSGSPLGVAHTHPEPSPFLNAMNLYDPVASGADVSNSGKSAGIVESSVITRKGVLTYIEPDVGTGNVEDYRKNQIYLSGFGGVGNKSQSDLFESLGTAFNVSPKYKSAYGESSESPSKISLQLMKGESNVSPIKEMNNPSYIETGVTSPDEYQPSGVLGLGGMLPAMPRAEQIKPYMVSLGFENTSDPVPAMGKFTSDFYRAPVSTVSGVANRLSFGATDFIYIPEPIVVKTGEKSSQSSISNVSKLPETTTVSGGNQTISEMGLWLSTNKNSIDRTNPEAVANYNRIGDIFTAMQIQNPIVTTTTGGTRTDTTTTTTGASGTKTYVTEWDKFVEGSGRVGRWLTGLTLAKQEAYKTTLAGDTSLLGEGKRAVFEIGTTIVNKPAELAPVAVSGWVLGGIGRAAPSFLSALGGGTGATSATARFLQTPGGAAIAKAGVVGAFGTAYTLDVTEYGKATPEETKTNIYRSVPTLASMYGGAGGLNWIGETRIINQVGRGGATVKGVEIQGQSFVAGKTASGRFNIGVGSPESFSTFTFGGGAPRPISPAPVLVGRLPGGGAAQTQMIGGSWKYFVASKPLPQAGKIGEVVGGNKPAPMSLKDIAKLPLNEQPGAVKARYDWQNRGSQAGFTDVYTTETQMIRRGGKGQTPREHGVGKSVVSRKTTTSTQDYMGGYSRWGGAGDIGDFGKGGGGGGTTSRTRALPAPKTVTSVETKISSQPISRVRAVSKPYVFSAVSAQDIASAARSRAKSVPYDVTLYDSKDLSIGASGGESAIAAAAKPNVGMVVGSGSSSRALSSASSSPGGLSTIRELSRGRGMEVSRARDEALTRSTPKFRLVSAEKSGLINAVEPFTKLSSEIRPTSRSIVGYSTFNGITPAAATKSSSITKSTTSAGAITTTTATRGQEYPWVRTTEKPSPIKTVTPFPPIPVPPLTGMFTWPAGTPGSTPGNHKRKAAFMETFMMGLDISLRGRRTKAAKSFTTPKKYKRTTPAKKKGGKK